MNPGRIERLHLLGGSSFSTGDDRARVPHTTSGRRGLASYECYDRFRHVLLCERRCLFLRRATDLADHHDAYRLIIFLEQSQRIDVRRAHDRIATDTDRRGLPEAERSQLTDSLVRQRSGARDDADVSLAMNVSRHDSDLALAGRDDARTVWTNQARRFVPQ